jgi:hypothetical protein
MTAPGPRVLLPIRGADPRRRPAPGAGLDGVVPVVEDGALLTFSGVESVRRWRPVARFVTAPAEEVDGVARRLGAREVVHDVAGPVRTRRACPGSLAVETAPFGLRGLAAPLAEPAIDRLRALLARHPSIERAWVVEATVDGAGVAVAAFEVEPGNDDPGGLVKGLAGDVVPLLPVDAYAGVQLVLANEDEVGLAIRAADDPVYVRS